MMYSEPYSEPYLGMGTSISLSGEGTKTNPHPSKEPIKISLKEFEEQYKKLKLDTTSEERLAAVKLLGTFHKKSRSKALRALIENVQVAILEQPIKEAKLEFAKCEVCGKDKFKAELIVKRSPVRLNHLVCKHCEPSWEAKYRGIGVLRAAYKGMYYLTPGGEAIPAELVETHKGTLRKSEEIEEVEKCQGCKRVFSVKDMADSYCRGCFGKRRSGSWGGLY